MIQAPGACMNTELALLRGVVLDMAYCVTVLSICYSTLAFLAYRIVKVLPVW